MHEAQPAAVLWAAAGQPGGHGPPPLADSSNGSGGGADASTPCLQLSSELLDTRQQPAARSRAAVGPGSGGEQPGQAQRLPYCYVIYTSGSTGAPLGVCGTEEGKTPYLGLFNLFQALVVHYCFNAPPNLPT